MCIFSSTLLTSAPSPPKPKRPFEFKQFWRKSVHKIDQSRQKEKIVARSNDVRLSLLCTYGITPPKFTFRRALAYSGATVGVGTVTGVGVPLAGTAAGFTANGVTAGSLAAAWQSSIGSVAAGSSFATLQGIGATGGFALLGPISIIAGVIGTTVAGTTLVGIGIDKHLKEINNFARKTALILPHV